MTDLYIYYRVRNEHTAQLGQRVRAMQQQMGLGQVKRRLTTTDGIQTWMETYTDVPPEFAHLLEAAVKAGGLLELIDGVRHTETFVDLPCA